MGVTLKDFQPVNHWKIDEKGEQYRFGLWDRPISKHIIDQTTNRKYLNEAENIVGFKCFLLTLGTPFVHPIALIINVAYRILKIATLSHFWVEKKGETKYKFEARLVDATQDLLRIIATPAALVGLELAAIYGLFRPYDGRKLYASIERAVYGNFILAPCFQPMANYHAFGGDIDKRNAF